MDTLSILVAARWRSAAMRSVTDLPEDTYVTIGRSGRGFYVEFTAADGKSVASLHGSVEAGAADPECGQVYEINVSEAPGGWGPFLYDLAMEYAYPKGLIADRAEVTEAAQRIWRFYMQSRPDVKKRVIRNPDCSAGTWEPALDFAYFKPPKLIDELHAANKLILK